MNVVKCSSQIHTVELHSFVDCSRLGSLDADLVGVVDFDKEWTAHDRLTVVQYLDRVPTYNSNIELIFLSW